MTAQTIGSGGKGGHAEHPEGASPRVLLVDDDVDVLAITAELLTEDGFDVVEADSAEAALRLIEQGVRVDAVVTDQTMPGLSGEELLRRCGIPGLLLTGHADAIEAAVGMRIVQKPFRSAQLLRELHAMVPQRG